MKNQFTQYGELLNRIKARIRQGQTRAILSANVEMICTYWDIGRMICERQVTAGWGAGVLPRLSRDLHNELPEVKGFSVRNLKLMAQFYREYSQIQLIGQQAVAQLDHWYEPQGKPWTQRFRGKPRGFDQARLVPVGDKLIALAG